MAGEADYDSFDYFVEQTRAALGGEGSTTTGAAADGGEITDGELQAYVQVFDALKRARLVAGVPCGPAPLTTGAASPPAAASAAARSDERVEAYLKVRKAIRPPY